MLELKSINSFYGGGQVLFDVNLVLRKGEVVALFGRNGVGKTTTFRSIMGLHPPKCNGEILYKGENILGLPTYLIARKGIGFVPEDRRIFPNLTVRQNLMVGQKSGRTEKTKRTYEEIYDSFPQFKSFETRMGANLSGGEQQMVTIGRTLMGNPDIILLDEPTEGLAPLIAAEVVNMIISMKKKQNISILIVEQFSNQFLDVADVCYIMERGRIVYQGSPMTLKEDRTLQETLVGVGFS